MGNKRPIFAINWNEVNMLVEGCHDNPHHILGMHESIDGVYINAYFPGAESVKVIAKDGKHTYDLNSERVAGFFSVKKVDNELELESLGVSPSYRGNGIGTVGLSAFEAMARKTGCESSCMICADCNPAIRLYEENGYQRVKEFSHWYVTSDEKKKG